MKLLTVFLISTSLATFDFFFPGPVVVDPAQVACHQEADIDEIAYRANVVQVYASLSGLCQNDNCQGSLGSVGALAGDMKIYNQDLQFYYEGKLEHFQVLVDKLVEMARNDKRILNLGGKQRFYKKAVIDCFAARLTVTTTGRQAVG